MSETYGQAVPGDRDDRSTARRGRVAGPVGELSYLTWGEDGPACPVVLLHPVNTAAAVWTSVAELLAPGRRLIAPDYRAHGASDPGGRYLPEDYAADAIAVLDALGVARADLVVGSIGGAVACEVAAREPDRVRSITAFGAGLRIGWSEETVTEAVEGLRKLGVRGWFTAHGRDILGPASRPDAADRLVEVAATARSGDREVDTVVEVLRATFVQADSRPAAEVLAKRPPPSRVLVGAHDPTCPPTTAGELAGYLGTEATLIDDIGHLPMLEDPVGTAVAIRRFLGDLEAAR